MKKTLLTTTFLVAGSLGLLAQGLITFDNNPYYFTDSIESGGTVDYKFYTPAGVLIDNPLWKAALFQNGTQLGASLPFDAGFAGVLSTANDPLFGTRTLLTPGGTLAGNLEVKIYNDTGAQVGVSPWFAYNPPTSPTAPPSDLYLNNGTGGTRAFAAGSAFRADLAPGAGIGTPIVPEPSTIALGGLGLCALLMFRRRK